jgi:membrane-associated protease RseP (regulator of RpoE activity)
VSRAEVVSSDEDRQFYRLGPGRKIIIMCGGPVMNLLIYAVLMTTVLTTLGLPQNTPVNVIGGVIQCVVPATSPDAKATTCPASATAAPAYGRLQPGDVVLSVDGTRTRSWDDLVAIVRRSAGTTLTLQVRRNGQLQTVRVTPVANTVYTDNSLKHTAVAGYLGVEPTSTAYFTTVPLSRVPGQLAGQVGTALSAVTRLPSSLGNLWDSLTSNTKRDPQGAIGLVGIGRLSGDIAGSKQTVTVKAAALLSLLASLNLLLFLLNLLPLLPLDGGHVAGAVVEAARRGWSRVRRSRQLARAARNGAPMPAPPPKVYVDTAQMLPVIYGAASVLAVVTLLVLFADIVKPITLS